jgi:ATP:corrinoid adenosyltransferase
MMQTTESDRERHPNSASDLLSGMKHFGRTQEEQIKINQQGLDLLKKWREEESRDEDIQAATKTWEDVKEIIDRERDRQLFS